MEQKYPGLIQVLTQCPHIHKNSTKDGKNSTMVVLTVHKKQHKDRLKNSAILVLCVQETKNF
jgi:hypothetical protein